MEEIKVVIDDGGYMPERAHDLDAGYDIRTPYDIIVPPSTPQGGAGKAFVDTGIHIQIPAGYAGLLVSKSGLNVVHNITGTGLIDAGYTGSIAVKLYNHGAKEWPIKRGEKLIQLVIIPVATPDLVRVSELAETDRGAAGFGSTGR